MSQRAFIIIHRHGHEEARGETARRALVNASIPGGTKNAMAVILKDLVAMPQRACGVYTAVVGNLVAEGGLKP